MTKNQFLKWIFNLNESWLKEKGFLPQKKSFDFIKVDDTGYQQIQLSCAQVGTRFYLTYGLLVRINKLEKMVNPFSGRSESAWKDGASILTSAIYLKGNINEKQYIIDKEEDIQKVNDDFRILMEEKGFAWLDKYSNNIALLDEELNADKPLDPDYLQTLMRPLYGIAAAKLNNNPDYDKIVQTHISKWEEKAHENAEFKRNIERIQKLAEHLNRTT